MSTSTPLSPSPATDRPTGPPPDLMLARWELANPARTLAEVVRRTAPRPGDVVLALLRCRSGGARDLLDAAVVVRRGEHVGPWQAAERLAEHTARTAGTLPLVAGHEPVRHVFVTVVCREGRVVPGPAETVWKLAWLRAADVGAAMGGDIYVLTPHGWTGCLDTRAGHRPALPPPRLSAVR
ncbi:hypothetical protein [Lapillicoccus jejuensis]|uniref:Uncharacterized protein n=1 Tax=Lapillicoccus jejuensis TaxID=402171 RepID=A0A542E722_9MICO|nr:hypothetical protein [Lapillicoccus jejuensis]TQJ11089.1 hypothetical protein FB458_4239 [Lapillicoccus jejuensis]